MDKRAEKLAKLIVNYCLEVKPGQKIFLDGTTAAEPFIEQIYKQILKKGAIPVSNLYTKYYHYILLKNSTEMQLTYFPNYLLEAAKDCDAVIDIENEHSDLTFISPKKREIYMRTMKPYWDFLIYQRGKLKRLTMLLPDEKEAKIANMSLKQYEDYIYSACLLDWKKLSKKFLKTKEILENGSEVHLLGEGVDLTLSIKGRNAVLEDGKENMPGGEIYMAPIKDSINGWIKFDYPAYRDGMYMSEVYFEFKDGKIINYNAKAGKKALKSLLDTDEGARYVGEFAFGINPNVKKPTGTWMDEKIDGTIHLAIGQCYEENKGDNNSAVHFDFVKDMRKGKILLDGKIIQEKGKWLI